MNCEISTKLIDDLIEDVLDDQTADQVSLHILDCQNCTAQFEILEREKQIYSHYLFEVEPPIHLSVTFQTKLEAVASPTNLTSSDSFISKIFAFLRLNPALVTATALVLLMVTFGLLSLFDGANSLKKANLSQPNFQSRVMTLPKVEPNIFVEKPKSTKVVKAEKRNVEIVPKPIQIKQTKIINKTAPKRKSVIKPLQIDAETQAQLKMIQDLEIETVNQIEKVELLLRSFRNARMIDGSEIYDIAYEKQQARKLLQKNTVLRQKAENYGTLFTAEMLNKVEPYLLDIANLEIDSTPEQVLGIKERVKSQNIIASLQGF